MITNQRQYKITVAQQMKLQFALAQLLASPVERKRGASLIHKLKADAMRSRIDDLRAQIEEYDALQSGKRHTININSFADLPRALIQARIAAGLTQRGLAELIGVKEQQIQRYEATVYRSASLGRVNKVACTLGMNMQIVATFPSPFDRPNKTGVSTYHHFKKSKPQDKPKSKSHKKSTLNLVSI